MKDPMAKERAAEQYRAALAEVEEQRDDAVVYLSAIKLVLEVLGRLPTAADLALVVAVTLLLAVASWWLIERPALRWKDARLPAWLDAAALKSGT